MNLKFSDIAKVQPVCLFWGLQILYNYTCALSPLSP